MFMKRDQQFETMAAAPERRHAAIRQLSRVRTVFFWVAVLISVLNIVDAFQGEPIRFLTVFSPVVLWLLTFKFQSDVRLLRAIDRLHRSEKSVA
jgi:hypothetical protein